MVKVTAPFHSTTAQGTLAGQIAFRRSPRGTIATRKPRHPQPIPTALRVNAILTKFLQAYKNSYGMITAPGWKTLAAQQNITIENAFIKYQIAQYKAGLPFRDDPDNTYVNPTPPKPELVAYLREGSTTPIIRAAALQDFDYISLHRGTTGDFTPTDENLITLFFPYNGHPMFEDRYDLHGGHAWIGYAWYILGGPSEPSDAVGLYLA